MRNLFAGIPAELPDELTETVLDATNVRIERMVSHGQASPAGFWYDQTEHEWVMVMQGAARLLFEGDAAPVELRAGDSLEIPAHRRHRVEWTTSDEQTVWLAVFYSVE